MRIRTTDIGHRVSPWGLSILTLAVLLCVHGRVSAETTVRLGTNPAHAVLKGTIITPDHVFEGTLVIQGDTIICAAVACEEPPDATLFTVTQAYIFPGFIDAHNHVAYNVLPKWTPPKRYQNRGQWRRAQAYKQFKALYAFLKDEKKLFCEMVKYGEIKALLSGVTTIQGTAPDQTCFRTLIRNAENESELPAAPAHIRTYILDIKSFQGTVDWTATKSFVVHLAEGVDQPSRAEFLTLKQKHLPTAQTVIIHGTAFGEAEFAEIAQVGAKLIWSPQSNLALYGQTTPINLARQQGVLISLGVDWNPTGSDHLFDELRVAAQQNRDVFENVIPPEDWIKMITVNPAKALALDALVGALAEGLKADITVLKARDSDPHASVLNTQLADVEMVWVGGDILYADQEILAQVKPGQCEALLVEGAAKRICVEDTKDPVPKSRQTLQMIQTVLKTHYPQLAPLAP